MRPVHSHFNVPVAYACYDCCDKFFGWAVPVAHDSITVWDEVGFGKLEMLVLLTPVFVGVQCRDRDSTSFSPLAPEQRVIHSCHLTFDGVRVFYTETHFDWEKQPLTRLEFLAKRAVIQ